MKKLNKKVSLTGDTIEKFYIPCACYCNCTCNCTSVILTNNTSVANDSKISSYLSDKLYLGI